MRSPWNLRELLGQSRCGQSAFDGGVVDNRGCNGRVQFRRGSEEELLQVLLLSEDWMIFKPVSEYQLVVPAPAVIPAPIVYINAAAVKKLVVGSRVQVTSGFLSCSPVLDSSTCEEDPVTGHLGAAA